MTGTEATYFANPELFRRWLRQHHASAPELLVGYHKIGSDQPSMSWPQSVDEALCYGWIDGVRKRIDAQRYCIRFTPRKPGSIWSAVNIKRVEVLSQEGRMQPAGLAAFARRSETRSVVYAYEQRDSAMSDEYLQRLKADPAAHTFFSAQAPWYRRKASWWVMSAKQDQTRERRLGQLIAASAQQRLI
ncbi:MAG: YdeI/OmpD-associated family protein [Stagnimonas sp.]|nr:YdeI/OmpD-associated family protein [Stagnimonas sp.]